jgi:uncharacterized phage protein (TIGR02218 family)
MNADLQAHLAGGLTTLCRCWEVIRRDGVALGFTDHDKDLSFAGRTFRADTGMSARALTQATGLSVDNTEALGVLSDDAITEDAIDEGRFDGAVVKVWLVNWASPGQRALRFRGTIGEIRRGAGAFHAELRGLTEALNQPQGRSFMRVCPAVLGDAACGFDLGRAEYHVERAAQGVQRAQVFRLSEMTEFAPRWFERGVLRVLDGAAAGLTGIVKHDRTDPEGIRVIELWEPIRAKVLAGDMLRIEAGCDKRSETCRFKFDNMANFQGFPFIPGEDWLMAVPARSDGHAGGSLWE